MQKQSILITSEDFPFLSLLFPEITPGKQYFITISEWDDEEPVFFTKEEDDD